MVYKGSDIRGQAEIDRDFGIYEAGILRLKDIEELLNHLNTLGFWKEDKRIRAKLKDITKIPEIEKEIETLKRKIIKKHGKKDLYRRSFSKLKRKRARRKKEVVVGEVPEPVSEVLVSEQKGLLMGILPSKKNSSQKKYEDEVKGAIGDGAKKQIIVDSSFSEEQEKERKRLEIERASVDKERKDLERKQRVVGERYEKYHDIPLRVEGYSYDKEHSVDLISKLKKLHALKGRNKFLRKIV
jgi:hypothetical protein